MIQCPKCHQNIIDTAQFCNYCGAACTAPATSSAAVPEKKKKSKKTLVIGVIAVVTTLMVAITAVILLRSLLRHLGNLNFSNGIEGTYICQNAFVSMPGEAMGITQESIDALYAYSTVTIEDGEIVGLLGFQSDTYALEYDMDEDYAYVSYDAVGDCLYTGKGGSMGEIGVTYYYNEDTLKVTFYPSSLDGRFAFYLEYGKTYD